MSDRAGEESRARPLAARRLAIEQGRLEISPAPSATRFSLRCSPEHADELGAIFAVPLPIAACRAAVAGARAALWLGPDEWLLLAEECAQAAIQDAFAAASSRLP